MPFADLSTLPGPADSLSLCSTAGRPGLAICSFTTGPERRSEGTAGWRGHVYTLEPTRGKLASLMSFALEGEWNGGESAYPTLRCAIPGERLLIFSFTGVATEGLAGQMVVADRGGGAPKQRTVLDSGLFPPRLFRDLGAFACSPDGASLAAGEGRRLVLLQRASRRVIPLQARRVYAYDLAFSADGRRLAWIGDTASPGPPDEEWAPGVNAVGVLTLRTRRSVSLQLSRVKGKPKRWTFPAQAYSHVAVSNDGRTVYLLTGDGGKEGYSLGRVDIVERTFRKLADGIQDFALIAAGD